MKTLHLLLTDSCFKALTKSAQKKGVEAAQYCAALLSELAEIEVPGPDQKDKHNVIQNGQATHVDLKREILAYLTHKGGTAPKTDVEHTLFEKFRDIFESPHYSELVGGGVPRWKKNLQFARNTMREMGLIKLPNESGRGIWELTQKGHGWTFE